MVDLRQRHSKLANGSPKSGPPQAVSKIRTLGTTERELSTILSDNVRLFLVSVALSCFALLFYRKQEVALSESYVLCSRSGQRIYTVDDSGSRVQCIAVHYSEIVDTGSLGQLNSENCIFNTQ